MFDTLAARRHCAIDVDCRMGTELLVAVVFGARWAEAGLFVVALIPLG